MFELEARIGVMQGIATHGVTGMLYGRPVHPMDAQAYVAVWQKLSEGNRARMESIPVEDAIEIAWRVIETSHGGPA